MPRSIAAGVAVAWVQGRGLAFNAARAAELLWRQIGPRGFDQVSDLRLDVVMPAADKDKDVLPLAVSGLRRNLSHPLGRIFVVTARESATAESAAALGCEVVDEDEVLPIRRVEVHYRDGAVDRSGWLFQQLLKLSADEIAGQSHVLLVDADTVLIRPQTFTLRGKAVLLQSSEYTPGYFSACEAVCGLRPSSRLSFVTHHMLVSCTSLAELKTRIELHRHLPWWRAILDACELSHVSCFSEYELYGNHELSRHDVTRRWWANRVLPRDELSTIDDLERRFGAAYRTISFHHWVPTTVGEFGTSV